MKTGLEEEIKQCFAKNRKISGIQYIFRRKSNAKKECFGIVISKTMFGWRANLDEKHNERLSKHTLDQS